MKNPSTHDLPFNQRKTFQLQKIILQKGLILRILQICLTLLLSKNMIYFSFLCFFIIILFN